MPVSGRQMRRGGNEPVERTATKIGLDTEDLFAIKADLVIGAVGYAKSAKKPTALAMT